MDRIDIHQERVMAMVLVLDGYLWIEEHVKSYLDYFICLRHLFRSRAVTNLICIKDLFIFIRAQNVLRVP